MSNNVVCVNIYGLNQPLTIERGPSEEEINWGVLEGLFQLSALFVGEARCVSENSTPKQIKCGWETLQLDVLNEFILTGAWRFLE